MRERKKESTDPDPDPSHYHVTNTSVHSPVPSYQTHCSGLPCVRSEKDSLPSVLSFVGYAYCLDETIHTFTYSSHISMKNCRIPSSFLPSCSSTIFVSDICLCHCPFLCRKFTALTSRGHKRRYCPLVKFVYRLEIPLEIIYRAVLAQICIFTHIKFCFRISSSITSRLAYAII